MDSNSLRESNEVNVRKYRSADKLYLRHICKETAWENYKKNENKLESVCIMFNDYFTEQEPEHIWVVVDKEDKAFGYVICNTDYVRYKQSMYELYYPRLKVVAPEEIIFFDEFLLNLDKVADYHPAHFHIDILPEYQRMGCGHKLLDALGRQLISEGFETMMLYANSRNSVGYRFYINYGFKEIYDYDNGAVALAYYL
jgi:ribosomal protein S18 acetylase RimI-like enzyme